MLLEANKDILGKNQIKIQNMSSQFNKNILCKNQIGIQNTSSQFMYVQLHTSAKTTEIKLLRF